MTDQFFQVLTDAQSELLAGGANARFDRADSQFAAGQKLDFLYNAGGDDNGWHGLTAPGPGHVNNQGDPANLHGNAVNPNGNGTDSPAG